MKHSTILGAGCAILVAVAVFFLLVNANKAEQTFGSNTVGNDYNARQITSADASTTPLVLKTGSGSLGSVVITVPASAGDLNFYNSASTTATTSSLLKLGFTAASDVAGTYTFDAEYGTGIQLDVPVGFTGQYTVTWR